MHYPSRRRRFQLVLVLSLLLATLVWGAGAASAESRRVGTVYALTNRASANRVAVFSRLSDGTLEMMSSFATGGAGTGVGLGSQGALILSRDGRWLFAVNAGSDDISAFEVRDTRLRLVDKVSSGGDMPISLTVHDNLLYVLNAGEHNNITGFRVGGDGKLSRLAGSTRPLSGDMVGGAQVQFSPDGRLLVVTEKMTNLIDTYKIAEDGRASGPKVQPSHGMTPFGFAFARSNLLIVSEAFGGTPDASALSSYDVSQGGNLDVVSGSVGTTETAACWVVVTRDRRYTYTTNTGSDSISGYRIEDDGSLDLLDTDGRTGATGGAPTDMDLSRDSRYLYALNSGDGTISAFQVKDNGSLKALGATGSLPASAVGLAVR